MLIPQTVTAFTLNILQLTTKLKPPNIFLMTNKIQVAML